MMTASARILRRLADAAGTRGEEGACWAGAAALLELHRRQLPTASVPQRSMLASEIAGLWKLAGDEGNERRFANEVPRKLEMAGVLPAEAT